LKQEGENFLPDDSPTVYLYHHLHQRPFQKSNRFNHFGFLYPFEGLNSKWYQIFENELQTKVGTGIVIDVENEPDKNPGNGSILANPAVPSASIAVAISSSYSEIVPGDQTPLSNTRKRKDLKSYRCIES
jgi:hypothetical protein